MAGQPQTAESGRRRQRAEEDRTREAGLQQVGPARPPGRHVIDLEGDADAEQQRHRDDIGEVERQADQHADLQRDGAGNQQRHQRRLMKMKLCPLSSKPTENRQPIRPDSQMASTLQLRLKMFPQQTPAAPHRAWFTELLEAVPDAFTTITIAQAVVPSGRNIVTS